MPYVYQDAETTALPTQFPSLTSEVLTETFAQTFEENLIAAGARIRELREDYRTGKRLNADVARQRLKDRGLDQDIKVSDAGITEAALNTLMSRKEVEKRRQEVFASAEGGFIQGAAKLGVGLVTSLVDPINVASAFIPVVGEARYANLLGRAGGFIGRAGVRAGVGAAEGVVGAALVEPLIAGMRRYEQADYDMADSLLNVGFGGIFGAGLHSVGGAVSDGVRHVRSGADDAAVVTNLREEIARGMDARDVARATQEWTPAMRKAAQIAEPERTPAEIAHQSLPPQLRKTVLQQAIIQAVTGEPVNVQPLIRAAELRQTQTPEFRRWFGESKVVDDAGEPLRVYHGTASEFDTFDVAQRGRQTGGDDAKAGFFFAENPKAADEFTWANGQKSGSIMPVFLSMKNPMISDHVLTGATGTEAGKIIKAAKAAGHDGVIFNKSDMLGSKGKSYAVFEPTQIKSAIGNTGRFDPSSSSITDQAESIASAIAHAEETLAREVDTGTPTADALKMATEEAALAKSDLDALAKRLGEEAEDAELTAVLDAAKNAERWAQAAELATVCLVRGG